jgi:hypothetical protein
MSKIRIKVYEDVLSADPIEVLTMDESEVEGWAEQRGNVTIEMEVVNG